MSAEVMVDVDFFLLVHDGVLEGHLLPVLGLHGDGFDDAQLLHDLLLHILLVVEVEPKLVLKCVELFGGRLHVLLDHVQNRVIELEVQRVLVQ